MPEDEVTGRTARLSGLEIRVEAGEKANQEVIGVQSTLHKLKWIIVAAGVVGVFINAGIWLDDKWQHVGTKAQVEVEHETNERQGGRLDAIEAVMRGMVDTQKRTLDGVDEVKKILMERRR